VEVCVWSFLFAADAHGVMRKIIAAFKRCGRVYESNRPFGNVEPKSTSPAHFPRLAFSACAVQAFGWQTSENCRLKISPRAAV
jgi:hypothetical protein